MLNIPSGKTIIYVTSVVFLVACKAWADIISPTVTSVYFEKAGQPYRGKVDFTVNCFGSVCFPHLGKSCGPERLWKLEPSFVFSFSASCPDYVCQIHEPFYLNYRYIRYCSIKGTANGQKFEIQNYAKQPVDFRKCKTPGDGTRHCELRITLPK